MTSSGSPGGSIGSPAAASWPRCGGDHPHRRVGGGGRRSPGGRRPGAGRRPGPRWRRSRRRRPHHRGRHRPGSRRPPGTASAPARPPSNRPRSTTPPRPGRRPAAVGVAAHQGPGAHEGQAPAEPPHRRPAQHRPVRGPARVSALGRLAHVPAVRRRRGVWGWARPASTSRPVARSRTNPVSRVVGPSSPCAGRSARRRRRGGSRRPPPASSRARSRGRSSPATPASARPPGSTRHTASSQLALTCGAPVGPHHVVGVADGVEPLVAAHAPGVVGQQLARGGLLARRPQHPPQPPAARRQAGRGQVVERLGQRRWSGRRGRRPTCRTRSPAGGRRPGPRRRPPRFAGHSMPCSRA